MLVSGMFMLYIDHDIVITITILMGTMKDGLEEKSMATESVYLLL